MNPHLEITIISLFIIILFFVLIRSIILWYYKIDKRISLMEENNELLKKLLDR